MSVQTWSYIICKDNGCLRTLSLLRHNVPYSTFNAKSGSDGITIVRNCTKYVFDIAIGLVEDLPVNEVAELLSIIHDITYELSGMMKSSTLP